MQNSFFCSKSYLNVYELASKNSNISTQLLYGEKFKVIKRNKKFLKIKADFDDYVGFIKVGKFNKRLNKTYKVSVLKSKIYSKPKSKFGTKKYLPFSSEIEILNKNNNFAMFEKNKWIRFNDLEIINKRNTDFTKILKIFLNCKYKWGGKSFDGIDCSALLQIFYKFNNKFFPRDTIDQIKIKRGTVQKKIFKKGDIIFWKGHVAICLNSKNLIHAYGPRKKVLIMPINKTIKIIEKTANLKVAKVVSI
ncbi:C40 family peptidase [Candidatus Pelagibacter sp.]|nr:C40 family peptidase [Candidatus Pelagibacter sp.]